ncbi:MAG: lipopolysaccharide biosynthesis protein [Flavobacteriales bacterium]
MIRKWKKGISGEFAKNVLTLMTGTVIGQAAVLLLSPVITRLFNAEDLAGLEQYTMIIVVLSVIVTGKYEFAIMAPKSREDARLLLVLSLRIAFFVCLALLAASFFLADQVSEFYNNPSLGRWLWTLPIALLAMAMFNSINYWFTRQKNFKVSATSKIWFSAASEPMKIGTGLAALGSAGLYVSTLAGNILSAVYCFFHFRRDEERGLQLTDKKRMWQLAREFREYPFISIWGSILNRIAQWAHIGVFSFYYGIEVVGYMALCRRVVQAPLNIVSNSYSQVFYQRISEFDDPADLGRFYTKNLMRFLAFAALMVVVIQVWPDNTMGFIFGADWRPAMEYLKILVFWFALNFVTSSLAFITYRIRIQKAALFLDALHFAFIYGAILYSHHHDFNKVEALKALVCAKVVYFATNILLVYLLVKKYSRQSPVQG